MARRALITVGKDWTESRRLAFSVVVGLAVGTALSFRIEWPLALLSVWDVTAALMLAWIWLVVIAPMDAGSTRERATSEDATRTVLRVLLVTAALTSLVGVVYAFVQAGDAHGYRKPLLIGYAVLTVVLSWGLVHTLYTLRYAHLYYSDDDFPTDGTDGAPGGIDFKNRIAPAYSDFAYVAFTIGMTFQVADTDVRSPTIRSAVIRHSALSYVFGTVIVASAINIVASALR